MSKNKRKISIVSLIFKVMQLLQINDSGREILLHWNI